jgi:hypothetical protein
MKSELVRAEVVGLVLFALTAGCGGSSSETPYPLEPVPQAAKSEPQVEVTSEARSDDESSGTGGGSP